MQFASNTNNNNPHKTTINSFREVTAMPNNSSGAPREVLTELGLTGIPKEVVRQELPPEHTVYMKRHSLNLPPFAGPYANPGLDPDHRLEVAVQFFSEENRDSQKKEMHGGRERLRRRCVEDYHAFGLVPVVDVNANPNERWIPSLVSLQECRQELPGPNICHNFPSLPLSIYQFWNQPVAMHQSVKVYSERNGNQDTTWLQHMQGLDAILYRFIFQECPSEIKTMGGGTIGLPKSLGGPDFIGSFRAHKINLIATAIYHRTVSIVSDKADQIFKLKQMLKCQHRASQDVGYMVICPCAMKLCKLIHDDTPITMKDILDVNIKDKIQKDCYSKSKDYGIWSKAGVMPRLDANSSAHMGFIAVADDEPEEPAGGFGPPMDVIRPYTDSNNDVCKGLYYPFYRMWRCIGTSNIRVKEELYHITDEEKTLLDRPIDAIDGPRNLHVGEYPVAVVKPTGVGPVQYLPGIPMEPLTKTRWGKKGG